jgi:hypothetical protein
MTAEEIAGGLSAVGQRLIAEAEYRLGSSFAPHIGAGSSEEGDALYYNGLITLTGRLTPLGLQVRAALLGENSNA